MAKKREERENELLSYLTDEERQVYDDYEKKLKETRDIAIRRHKAELEFWRKIDEREDEVYQHIMERREARQPEQPGQQIFQSSVQDRAADIRQALLGNQPQ